MTRLEKVELAVEDLAARGVRRPTAAPVLYRLLWRLGVAVPPPLYQSFLGVLLLQGFAFGALLGAILACADRRLAPDGATVLGTGGGAVFGALMALYYRWHARRLGLPAWADFGPDKPVEEDADW